MRLKRTNLILNANEDMSFWTAFREHL